MSKGYAVEYNYQYFLQMLEINAKVMHKSIFEIVDNKSRFRNMVFACRYWSRIRVISI